MFTDTHVTGLTGTARRLGVDPFEVVRLAVVSGDVPELLTFTDEAIQALEAFGGLETWWPEGRTLPPGVKPREARLRTSLTRLLDLQGVGERWTRIDNLWRDLSGPAREELQADVGQLLESGHLATEIAPSGVRVMVTDEAFETVRSLAEGRVTLDEI